MSWQLAVIHPVLPRQRDSWVQGGREDCINSAEIETRVKVVEYPHIARKIVQNTDILRKEGTIKD